MSNLEQTELKSQNVKSDNMPDGRKQIRVGANYHKFLTELKQKGNFPNLKEVAETVILYVSANEQAFLEKHRKPKL